MTGLTGAFLAAVAVLGLCLLTACAPRQPPGGDLWRIVSHSEVTP